jgi:hypothetical protein
MYGEHDSMRQDYGILEDLFPTTAQFVLIRCAVLGLLRLHGHADQVCMRALLRTTAPCVLRGCNACSSLSGMALFG